MKKIEVKPRQRVTFLTSNFVFSFVFILVIVNNSILAEKVRQNNFNRRNLI